MKMVFPSPEFDDAVAAVCHGEAGEEQCRALNELLRNNASALDEYILRVELHSRLASDEDLYFAGGEDVSPLVDEGKRTIQADDNLAAPKLSIRKRWAWGVAALLALAAIGVWQARTGDAPTVPEARSQAVAMLDRSVRAQWSERASPLAGDSLEPGWLTLESGLAQVVFYKGARLMVEGPAEFQLLTPNHLFVRSGKLTAEIPSLSSGFQVDTPQGSLRAEISNLGLEVAGDETSVHVFTGEVSLQSREKDRAYPIKSGIGVLVTDSGEVSEFVSDGAVFASLYDFHAESSAALAMRRDYWEVTGERLNSDPSLLVRFDFDQLGDSQWRLRNLSERSSVADHAAIVGCHWGEGRWPGKRALEFQNVNDRVRLDLPGEYESMTLSTWVRVQGLDRELNSLFMSDGFEAKTIHWLIREDGVLGMTVVGDEPGDYQIVASPPVLKLDSLGRWVHLAVVIDGESRRVTHFLNGREVDSDSLLIEPPYRVGPAEIGNWSAYGFPEDDPFMIRNFSGAMDEFCLFDRALGKREIQALYSEGRPDIVNLAALE